MLRDAVHLAVLILCVLASTAATATVASVPRTDQLVVIDGQLDEAAWRDASRVEVNIETRPGENVAADVTTVAYLVEDGNNLYVAFEAQDPDPSRIRAYLRDRDTAWDDDFVGVVIDTYGDGQRAFEFFVNPYGVQMDLTNDDVNRNEDESWDAIWDSAGQIGEDGYVVEIQIPLTQLRFPRRAGLQSWGVDVVRFYPREYRYRISNNALDRNRNCYLCQLALFEGFEDAEPGRDLEVAPTLTATRSASTDDPAAEPLGSGDTDVEAGLSVRWGITPDFTANLALNPDFSQVEADVAQLDVNNQFALYYPEKRPFFLEGADYFSAPIQTVFTRTVADPSVGAKLTGKRGPHTVGFFAAQDEITNFLLPGPFESENASLDAGNTTVVGRYSRGFGDASTVGAIATAREGDGYHNRVGGVDLRWHITDQHNLQAQYLRSTSRYPDAFAAEYDLPTGDFRGDATELRYNYDSRNWVAYLEHSARSAGFRADAGFVPQVDYERQTVGLGRIWQGADDDWYSSIDVVGDWDITHDDQGRLLERELEAYVSVNAALQSHVEIGGLSRDTLFDDVLYRENKFSVYAQVKPRGGLAAGGFFRAGSQVDFANGRLGDEIRLEPFVNWNVSRHLLLRYSGVLVSLDTQDGEQIFDARVHDLRLTWQFSVRSFIRLTAQMQDVKRNPSVYIDEVDAHSRNVGRQLLYSYKLNPQTVFFLGYSDALLDDDSLNGLTSTDRTWFLKLGYAWTG